MSRLNSKLDSINELRLEPISGGKAIKATKVAKVDNTIVVLGEDGTIYSNSVEAHFSYPVTHGREGMRLGRVLDACIKLGVLSSKAVAAHKADAKARQEQAKRKYAARLDWLADPGNQIGNVHLPTECVLAHPESMRAAIDAAMRMEV